MAAKHVQSHLGWGRGDQAVGSVGVAFPLDTRLFTMDEAAELLRCSKRTIERRVASEELAAVRNGRRVLVPVTAIRAFIARNEYKARTGQPVVQRESGAVLRRLWD